jgi:lipoyl-dependent peroxiredoxin
MSDKTAALHWEGQGKKGVGKISTETQALKAYPYGFASRFEDDKRGTNPEELLAAAHAACSANAPVPTVHIPGQNDDEDEDTSS